MEEKSEEKTTVTTGQAIMLSSFFLVMLFIFAFGCYGCAYQSPLTVVGTEEGHATLVRLAGTTWRLDTEAGEPNIPELYGLVITDLAFEEEVNDDGSLNMVMEVKGKLPVQGALRYDEDLGIILIYNTLETLVRASWSSSKDGKTETITFRGGDSNIQCYYLKI